MNLSMKYLFPNLNARQHCPIGPNSVPLADVTAHVFGFGNFDIPGIELEKLL